MLRALPSVLVPAAGVGVEVAPQQLRGRDGQRDQVAPIDRDARAFRRNRAHAPLLEPSLEAHVPKSECLERRRLAGVVRADQDDLLAEIQLDLLEELEVSYRESRQHRCRS